MESSGLYRVDGLAMIKESGQHADRVRKGLIKIFQEQGLKVTIEANLKIGDFLDIILSLSDGTHRPFNKPGNNIKYVSADSNHPPHIKKAIPKMVAARLSKLSSSEEIFNQEAPPYKDALRKAGHMEDIKYTKDIPKKTRRRKVIWFRPPWSNDVSTNIGARFLKIFSKHFPANGNLHKLFNRNSVKVSYGCLPNMDSILTSHNAKILNPSNLSTASCNCKGGAESCPVEGQCLQSDVVYSAEVKTEQDSKVYIGSTQDFKARFTTHLSNTRLPAYENATSLSTYIWSLKKNNTAYSIKWKILAKARSYCPESGRCGLCSAEKARILFYPGTNLINKRSEIMAKCRHRAKHKLDSM